MSEGEQAPAPQPPPTPPTAPKGPVTPPPDLPAAGGQPSGPVTPPKAGVTKSGGGVKSLQQIEVDQSKVWNLWFTRREFLTLAAWGTFLAALSGSLLAALRFFLPRITYDPPSVFKIGRVEDYSPGAVDERWKKKHRIWVVRDDPTQGGGLYVIFARCTHLGCTPNWLTGQNKFKCPCHGSGFRFGGINFEGPAPRPLERCQVAKADDGKIQVDINTRFRNPKDWKKPEAYLV